jgi:DNA-binding NarL/FixJ family response regulator
MATKILIVDDHYLVIEGIRSLLQDDKSVEIIGHAMTAESCLAFLGRQLPDIILMDINLPDKTGIELCKEVKQKYPAIDVVGLSTFNQQSFIEKMMENGASGYVLKNATRAELLECIEAVSKGGKYLSYEAGQVLRKHQASEITVLTRREKEILGLIAEGLTNIEIATQLFISATTVDTHRKNLLLKMGAKNTAELVKLAMLKNLISFTT